VAVVAVIAAGDVRRVFTGRGDAVMTRTARAHYLRVVDRIRGRPYIGVVAIFADVAGLDMIRRLAGGAHTVMAAKAVADNIYMIEGCRSPSNGRVTIIAGVAAGDVRWVFTGRGNAVMTRTACADHLRMVNGKYGRKHIGVVAVFADIAGLDMIRRLAGSVHAVMAVDAVADDIYVIEVRR